MNIFRRSPEQPTLPDLTLVAERPGKGSPICHFPEDKLYDVFMERVEDESTYSHITICFFEALRNIMPNDSRVETTPNLRLVHDSPGHCHYTNQRVVKGLSRSKKIDNQLKASFGQLKVENGYATELKINKAWVEKYKNFQFFLNVHIPDVSSTRFRFENLNLVGFKDEEEFERARKEAINLFFSDAIFNPSPSMFGIDSDFKINFSPRQITVINPTKDLAAGKKQKPISKEKSIWVDFKLGRSSEKTDKQKKSFFDKIWHH